MIIDTWSKRWRHNVTTIITCANGETITVTHDTNLPRPRAYNRLVQGTRGIWNHDLGSIYFEGRSPAHRWEPFEPYQIEFEHPVWRRYLQEGVDQAGHGGTDLLELRDFVRCVKHRLPVSIDVYDSAAWSVITPLSEQSVALGGQPISF